MSVQLNRRQFLTKTIVAVGATMVSVSPSMAMLSSKKTRQEHHITIRDFEYAPVTLEVAIGDRIIWKNEDIAPHTVTANDESWDSKLMSQNDIWSMDVTADMRTNYYCRYHPAMKAKLIISK